MFAGPNGSGKSELKKVLPPALLGVYLNPDDIEAEIRRQGFLDFSAYQVMPVAAAVLAHFQQSSRLPKGAADGLCMDGNHLRFGGVAVNAYWAAAAVDFIQQNFLAQGGSFTFETVMSHPGKVALLQQAQALGYRTYLYYVATEDPDINISRVRNRVAQGGHAVPEDRIKPRYEKSLDLLMAAIRHTNRAYIFDNSGEAKEHTWVAEVTDGREIELKSNQVPAWFKRSVLDKIPKST